jgi:polar amino acid transport system substrate-binding protein
MMKKLLSIACTALAVISCNDDTKKTDSQLTVGVSADYPPFEYFSNGKIVGFDIELLEEIAKRLQLAIEFKDMNFDGIIAALQSKRIDAGVSAISATTERKKAVDFSDNYFAGSIVMVCQKDSDIKQASDLSGKTIGLQSGSIYEPYANSDLSQQAPNLIIKTLPKVPDLIQDMKSGRLSCIIMGKTEGDLLVKQQSDFKVIPLIGSEIEIAIAFPKGSNLRDKVNTVLSDMKKDGYLDQLITKWLN